MIEPPPDWFPRMAPVRQQLYEAPLRDAAAETAAALIDFPFDRRTRPGETVAVAVGSRGIDRLAEVVGGCVRLLQARGLKPVLVPAMGSHGGGTAEGQAAVLKALGIGEADIGVPVRADMTVDGIARLDSGTRVFCARAALAADHIVVVNRVKPHTKFSAPIESGLCKMLTIGLGKIAGATEFHRQAVTHGFGIIEDGARAVLETGRVLFGLALLEDGRGRLARITAVSPDGLIDQEKRLLQTAAEWMGRIPFDPLDVLIVDTIGKHISGIGMDSNVTGRHRDVVGDFFEPPHVRRIFVRDLAPESEGNANGIGLADVTTRRLIDAIDMEKTYVNAIAAISPEKAAIPMHFETDRQAVTACIRTAGLENGAAVRLVRVADTKHVDRLHVSSALAPEVAAAPGLEQIGDWEPMAFDGYGNLVPFWRT